MCVCVCFKWCILSVMLKENGVGNFTVLGAANIDENSNLEITTGANHGTQLTIVSANSGSIVSNKLFPLFYSNFPPPDPLTKIK